MQIEIRIIKKPMQQGVLMPVIFRSEQNKNKGETDWNVVTKFSVQIIPRPIVTGESIVAWDESFIPVSSPIGQVPQNITKKRFS